MSEGVDRQLEDLYVKFNIDHPNDFRGHSMSVSDIVLLLVIGGSAIYCIVKALWQSLLILVVLGIATIAAVFLLVWAVMKAENIGESLGAFIRS